MAKVVLGNRPQSFKKPIKFMMVDESGEVTEGQMEVQYKYRTLTEFGAFMDEWTLEQKNKLEAEDKAQEAEKKKALDAGEVYVEPELTNEDVRKKQAEANTDYLMQIMVGWNLGVEFSHDTVLQFCNEHSGGAIEAMSAYRAAITEGRLGN